MELPSTERGQYCQLKYQKNLKNNGTFQTCIRIIIFINITELFSPRRLRRRGENIDIY
jgi:hypothetical protein